MLLELSVIVQIKWMSDVVVYDSKFSLQVIYPLNVHAEIMQPREAKNRHILNEIL